jgi:hypothetical protein
LACCLPGVSSRAGSMRPRASFKSRGSSVRSLPKSGSACCRFPIAAGRADGPPSAVTGGKSEGEPIHTDYHAIRAARSPRKGASVELHVPSECSRHGADENKHDSLGHSNSPPRLNCRGRGRRLKSVRCHWHLASPETRLNVCPCPPSLFPCLTRTFSS